MGRIEVRVTPRASRDALAGLDGAGRLRVRLAAPPVDGAANDALLRFLARRLGVPRSRLRIVRGAGARNKLIEVEGCTDLDLRDTLAACPE